jgi:hypothetical protein
MEVLIFHLRCKFRGLISYTLPQLIWSPMLAELPTVSGCHIGWIIMPWRHTQIMSTFFISLPQIVRGSSWWHPRSHHNTIQWARDSICLLFAPYRLHPVWGHKDKCVAYEMAETTCAPARTGGAQFGNSHGQEEPNLEIVMSYAPWKICREYEALFNDGRWQEL